MHAWSARCAAPRAPDAPARRAHARVRRTAARQAAWLESEVAVKCPDVPLAVAWDLWTQRERIPNWMPWITSVTVDTEDERLSKWVLSTDSTPMKTVLDSLGQRLEYSWTARNLAAVPGQKIHWKSIDGLANKGAVRFYPEGEGCTLKMSIAYEVPDALTGMGPAVSPVLESIIEADLKRFDQYAQDIMAGRV